MHLFDEKSPHSTTDVSSKIFYIFFLTLNIITISCRRTYCLYTDVSCPTKLKESQSEHYCIVFWLNGIFQIVACGVVPFVNKSQRIHKIFAKPRANQTNAQLQVTWVCVHYILIRYIVFVELNFFKTPETCESEVSNINKLHFLSNKLLLLSEYYKTVWLISANTNFDAPQTFSWL